MYVADLGDVAERTKAPHSKCGRVNALGGSNPPVSAAGQGEGTDQFIGLCVDSKAGAMR